MSKVAISIVILVFLGCFVAGVLHGKSDADQPDAVLKRAASFTHIAINDQKQIQLVYTCNTDIYDWDVGKKTYMMTKSEASRRLQSGVGSPRVPITTSRLTAAGVSVGGLAAAWNLKDVTAWITEGKSGQAKIVLAALAAAASGYGAGYWWGSRKLPSCDSPALLTMIDDSVTQSSQAGSSSTAVWKKIEKLVFEQKSLQLFRLCSQIENKAQRENEEMFTAVIYRSALKPDYDLTETDFKVLLGTEDLIRKETKPHTQSEFERFVDSIFPAILFVVPITIALVVASLWVLRQL